MNQELKTSARNEYLNHINTQKTSSLSIVEYCRLHKIDPNKFYYYKSYRRATSKPKLNAASSFTKVKIKTDQTELKLPAIKTQQRRDNNIDPVWLARFISTLSSCQ